VVSSGLDAGSGRISTEPWKRKATAVIAIALLAGACMADAGSEAPRSPAGTNADLRHLVVDTDLAFDDICMHRDSDRSRRLRHPV
jgi:hypothetical protein